jgi:radical SAM protein with 4Fe4S-binding SPASM domain
MKKYKKTYIEITNVCNLTCEFCPRTSRNPEFMDPIFFENILNQIEGHSKFIYFHVLGEPLLHPELKTFLDLSFSHGFKVNLTTNGTLINKVKDTLIQSPGLRQINLSLHSFDANPINQTMDEYLENIFSFIKEAGEKSNILFALRLWNLEEDVSPSSKEKNRYILDMIENNFKLNYKIEEALTSVRGINVAPNVFLNQASRFNWPMEHNEFFSNNGFCHGLRDQVAILVDGTVVPCCLDGQGVIKLGNIKETPFSEIIQGKRACALHDGFTHRKVVEELCTRCDFRRRFNK